MHTTPVPQDKSGRLHTWTWTEARREALKLTLEGCEQKDIAKRLKVHRHTVANWQGRPEFIAELRRELIGHHVSAKLRRVVTNAKLADRLGEKALDALDSDDVNVAQTQLFLKEHREYQRLESEQFGGGSQHGSAPLVSISIDDSRMASRSRVTSEPLRDFAARNLPKDFDFGGAPKTAALLRLDDQFNGDHERALQQARLIEATRWLVTHTDIVDAMYEEDLARERQRAAEKEARTRWR